jgi:hypothetical protein
MEYDIILIIMEPHNIVLTNNENQTICILHAQNHDIVRHKNGKQCGLKLTYGEGGQSSYHFVY